MRKYAIAYGIALQETLQRRATLIMDRIGGFAVVLSLYSFWAALLSDKNSFLGYTRPEMMTYVLLINVLRAFVFTGRGWLLVGDISNGRISSYLVRPISYMNYSLSLDLAQKTVHVASAILELGLLVWIVHGNLFIPTSAAAWLGFAAAAVLSSLVFFFLEFTVSSFAFWTSESAGPLFCFELIVQFASGAFFPLDVLPAPIFKILRATPFPYMVYIPMRIFLEKSSPAEALKTLTIEAGWLVVFALIAAAVWRRGISSYSAEGG